MYLENGELAWNPATGKFEPRFVVPEPPGMPADEVTSGFNAFMLPSVEHPLPGNVDGM